MQGHPTELGAPLFVDHCHRPTAAPQIWDPLLVTKEAIDAEIERLIAAAPANGRRRSVVVHPASRTANSFTPGTAVSIQVLLPGEATHPARTNANQLEITIRGGGRINAGAVLDVSLHDVWTVPPMQTYKHLNTGSEPWVRLTYSNAPLLELLGVWLEEEAEHIAAAEPAKDGLSERQRAQYARENAPDLALTAGGARLRGYEFLTDIPVVPNPAMHWPWHLVAPHLSQSPGDGKRTIWLLYHPATERRNGTTGTYFATIGGCPPGTPPFTGERGHRHTSAAINYHIEGFGSSVVDGVRVNWKAGDLLLSAPGWSEHAHYPGEQGWKVLTVQDHPLHIAMGSLLWQEKFDGPIVALGAQEGQKGYVGPRTEGA
ncbi:gentisate 1,2-dioxygenase [Variovorax sp. PBS-H4]|uniref:hypothetical protein n=1 Tax=Variovorax sp. PBS-H4 TaxID=434008 RepID=UPI001315C066|nr:hypothetical protein [Variovorax sp. PBS-H4]VTU22818.1 gentisate 1,2-dioxygenase [Variovorax sp. PBS-H4]